MRKKIYETSDKEKFILVKEIARGRCEGCFFYNEKGVPGKSCDFFNKVSIENGEKLCNDEFIYGKYSIGPKKKLLWK